MSLSGSYMEGTPLRVLFLSPYFRPYLGGIERAIERLSFQLMESPEVEAVGVLTTKYSFPPTPHPEWVDRERTPEGVSIFRLTDFPASLCPSIQCRWCGFRRGRFASTWTSSILTSSISLGMAGSGPFLGLDVA